MTIGFGHGYIRFGDGSQPSPKILFLVVCLVNIHAMKVKFKSINGPWKKCKWEQLGI